VYERGFTHLPWTHDDLDEAARLGESTGERGGLGADEW
jgi:hypothetical protein